MRVGDDDQLKLDGRLIRRQIAKDVPVFLVHRSPGEPLLPPRSGARDNGLDYESTAVSPGRS